MFKVGLTIVFIAVLTATVARGGGFRSGGYRNLFTIFAALLALIILLFTPQVYHLFHVPMLGWYDMKTFAEIFCLFAFLAGLLRLYVSLVFTIIPRAESMPECSAEAVTQPVEKKEAQELQPVCLLRGVDSGRLSPDLNRFERLCQWPISRAEHWSVHKRVTAGVLLLLGAGAWLLTPWLVGAEERSFLERPARCMFGTIAVLIAIWLLSISHENIMGYVKNMQGRALVCLSVTYALGETVWRMADHNWFSMRVYTLWAILQLLFLPIFYARVIDTWHIHSRSGWVRLGGLAPLVCYVFLLAFLYAKGPPDVGRPRASSDTGFDYEIVWLTHFENRLDAIENLHSDGPVVFIAASGGGSRAALFTALVLEALSRIDGMGNPLPDPAPEVAVPMHCRIAIMSSVSGGSLGTAYYAAQRENDPTAALPSRSWRNVIKAELIGELRRCADHFYKEQINRQPEQDNSNEQERQKHLEAQKRARDACLELDGGQINAGANKFPSWLLSSTFADDVGTDFMAPLLRGVLYLGLERGLSVSRLWEKQFGWQGKTNQQGFSADRTPLLLLNACDVDSGLRVVIGFPQIPPILMRSSSTAIATNNPILEMDPTHEFTLAEAVRMSANFPWGFEVARINAGVAGGSPQTRYIMDGGIIDNTGLDSMAYLLDTLHNLETSNSPNNRTERAGRILDKLRRRGVLLVEIDSGAKSQSRAVAEYVLPTIFEPLRGLNNSANGNTVLNSVHHVASMMTALTDHSDGKIHLAHVKFTCNHFENVMTAWALGTDDKAKIIVQFLTELNYNISPDLNPTRNIASRARQAHAGLTPTESRELEEKDTQDASRRRSAYEQMERTTSPEPQDRTKK